MANHHKIENLVSRYLEGELPDIERLDFESQLITDPLLQEEYHMQKDMIEAIKQLRRTELKSKLAQIHVPEPFWFFTPGFKIAAISSFTAIVGVATYLYFSTDGTRPIKLVDLPSEQTLVYEDSFIPSKPRSFAIPTPVEIEAIEVETPSSPKEAELEANASPLVLPKRVLTQPHIVLPDMGIADNAKDVEPVDNSAEMPTSSFDRAPEKVTVEMIKAHRKNFHYRFYGSKLFLYGEFDQGPYEILEINTPNGKKYFLYYEHEFYALDQRNYDISQLEKIKDDNTITDLKIMMENK